MKSGYNIFWTDHALAGLAQTITYLEENWTEKEIRKFSQKLEETISFISQNPYLLQRTDFEEEIRIAVILKNNTLYFRIINGSVELVSLFSNWQNPKKRIFK